MYPIYLQVSPRIGLNKTPLMTSSVVGDIGMRVVHDEFGN
jgi:hypothetical protein